ncbi:MAG: Rab family GTPase [Promethearchaeota archaeon]
MYFDEKKLKALLKWYRQEIGKELIAVLIVDRVGLIVDFLTKIPEKAEEKEFIGAFSALADLILKKITSDYDLGTFGAGTFDTDKYRFIFCEAGPECIFVTVLNGLAIIDPYFPYAFLAAEKVARIFDGRPVSPVIPKINTDYGIKKVDRKVDTLQKMKLLSDDYLCKLSFIGDGGVGKTSIVQRYVNNIFLLDYRATIGTYISKKICKFEALGNAQVRFVIWDIAGQPQFTRIRPAYLADSGAIMIVYDVSSRESFDNVKKIWYEDVKKVELTDSVIVLVGNKMDLEERQVTYAEGEALANELGMDYIETSAKSGENVEDAHRLIALKLVEKFVEMEEISKIVVENQKYMINQEQLNYIMSYIARQKNFIITETGTVEFQKCLEIFDEIRKNKIEEN